MTDERYNSLSAEDATVIRELSGVLDIADAERLPKGCERKFRIENTRGERALLRITDMTHYEWTKNDPDMYNYVYDAGIPITHCVGTGIFHEGQLLYQLYSWFDGVDLTEALPPMSRAERYAVGVKCGKVMRRLHALPPRKEVNPWGIRFARMVEAELEEQGGDSEIARVMTRMLDEEQALIESRPQSFTHGDWNPENLMLCTDGQIGIIDLSGEHDVADPWWEFWLTPIDSGAFDDFYAGQLDGYFDGEPPEAFLRLLSCYIAFCELKYPHDAPRKIGEREIDEAVKRLRYARL